MFLSIYTRRKSILFYEHLSAVVTKVLLPLGRVSLWELRLGVLLRWSCGAVLGRRDQFVCWNDRAGQ